jgi:ectoine hydroxylase-related dioxygenase (phytanoyl-CoA dioxygenase family)
MPIESLICPEPGRLPCEPERIAARILAGGAVYLRRFERPEVVAGLRAEALRLIDEDLGELGPDWHLKGVVYALMTRSRTFLDWMTCPPALAIFRALLGHGCIVHHYCVSAMPPAAKNYASEIHSDVPRARLIPGYATNIGLLLACDPFTPQSGAFELVPDSAFEPGTLDADAFARRRVVADLAPGDAIFFNTRCLHRGGHNRGGDWRVGIALQACRVWMKQLFDYCRMFPPGAVEAMPAGTQQFLGWWARMPVSFAEYSMPPDRRPWRAGQE